MSETSKRQDLTLVSAFAVRVRDTRNCIAGITQHNATLIRPSQRPLSRNGKKIRTPGVWNKATKASAGSRRNKKFRFCPERDSDFRSSYSVRVEQPTAPQHELRYADITRVFPKIG